MKPPLQYGLLAAVCMSAWMLGEYALGLHTTRVGIGHYTSFATEIIFVGLLWRLLHQQVRQPGRYWLPVWEGLLQGALTGLVAALGFYVFVSAYLNFINPDYAYLKLEWEVPRLRAAGTSEEEIRAMAKSFLWSVSPRGLPVTILGLYLLIAVVASPLLTLWLNWRHKEPVRTG
jgi:hypothetical protein